MTDGITPYYCINGQQIINKNRIEENDSRNWDQREKTHCGAKQMHAAHNIVSNLNLLG